MGKAFKHSSIGIDRSAASQTVPEWISPSGAVGAESTIAIIFKGKRQKTPVFWEALLHGGGCGDQTAALTSARTWLCCLVLCHVSTSKLIVFARIYFAESIANPLL